MALHSVRAITGSPPTEYHAAVGHELRLASVVSGHRETSGSETIICITQPLCLDQDVRRQKRTSDLVQSVKSKLRLKQRIRKRRNRPKTFTVSVMQDLHLTHCTFIPRPVYYRVIPTPADMQSVADEVDANMRFERPNRPGWQSYGELIVELSTFIESLRE